MDFFALFLIVLGLFAGVVAPILAVVAFGHGKRLADFERELIRLRRELEELRVSTSSSAIATRVERPRPSGEATLSGSGTRAPSPSDAPIPTESPGRATSAPQPVPPQHPFERAIPRAKPPPVPAMLERSTAPPRVPAEARRPRVEWERWLGVRGAALLSGIAIAIAGVLFFRHAIEQGWITAEMRVATGFVAGLAAIGGGELLRRRSFRYGPAALAGAGVVLLYASVWAGYRLYELAPLAVAFPAMAAITVACGWLSMRHASQTVAALGLLGGFATPLLLQTRAPNPIGLFSYVLLLDLGLIALGRRMRWPALGILGVAGTSAIELLWFRRYLDASSLPVTLVALGALGLVFAAVSAPRERDGSRAWWPSQAAAVLVPFLFALELALRAELGRHLYPLALLAAVLEIGACWTGARQRLAWLAPASAAAGVALVAAWALRSQMDTALAWELALCSLGLGLPFPLLTWRSAHAASRPEGVPALRLAGAVSAGGLLTVLCVNAAVRGDALLAPLVSGLVLVAALLHHAGRSPALHAVRVAAGGGLGLGLALLFMEHGSAGAPWQVAGLLLGAGTLLHAAAFLEAAGGGARRAAWHAAALFSIPLLVLLPSTALFRSAGPLPALSSCLLLGLSTAAAASALRGGAWLVAATICTSYVQTSWIQLWLPSAGSAASGPADLAPLAIALASAFLFSAWPLLFRARHAESPSSWRAAALAPLVWLPGTMPLFERRISEDWIGLLPLACCAALAAVLRLFLARVPSTERERSTQRVAVVWLGTSAALFASMALPLTLERYELRVTAALFGAASLALWRRIDHAGVLLMGLGSLWWASIALFLGALPPSTYPSSDVLIWNWTSYAHLVPAACFGLAAVTLRPVEVSRSRGVLAPLHRSGAPVLSSACGLLAAVTVFLWINLALFDYFGEGERVTIDFSHDERRDLALSIAWIVYAIALLALGMARRLTGLRWMSLAFLVLSLAKVFLYDLGELEGLYRVCSLLGLGLSLLLVSLLYQRFVFPRDAERAPTAESG